MAWDAWSRKFVISRVSALFIFFLNQIHILCQRLTDTGKIPGITLAASWASISIWGHFFSLQETAPFSQIPPSALFHLFWTLQHLRAKEQLGQCLWNSWTRQPSSFYRSLLEVEYLLLFSFLWCSSFSFRFPGLLFLFFFVVDLLQLPLVVLFKSSFLLLG